MIYEVKWSGKFKKGYKLAKKRGLDISLFQEIIDKLRRGIPLEEKHHDYLLENDVLTLTLVDTGTHADLFDM